MRDFGWADIGDSWRGRRRNCNRGSGPRRRGKLVGRVDVAKGIRFVVEVDLDHAERRIPGVDLAAAGIEKRGEVWQGNGAYEAENRMRLVERLRDAQRRSVAGGKSLAQPPYEVCGQERRIARHGDDVVVRRTREAGMKSRERSRETTHRVGHDRMAEFGIA